MPDKQGLSAGRRGVRLGSMSKNPLPRSLDPDEAALPPGPYDRDPADEADIWFLPPEESSPEDDLLPPGPRADRRPLFDIAAWRAAQDRLSGELAAVAVQFGALDERLRAGPEGWRQRLALIEVEGLSWWSGDRITLDRLALWSGLRLAGAQEDSLALARSGWALRRLGGGPPPDAGGWIDGVAQFLGRHATAGTDLPGADLAEVMRQASDLHPVTRAAILFQFWRMLGHGPATDIEAAVMAMRLAAGMGRGHASFLPLAQAGFGGLRAAGAELPRLAAWLAAAEQAVLAALLHLDRVADWSARADAALAGCSGRTPAALAAVFAGWPMVTAPMAEARLGSSRAAVQRNLDLLQERALIREITGQGRYRVWTAALSPVRRP